MPMTQRALPRPGEFYRHFKNRLYQIVAVAYNADDGSPVVVYQALYGDFRVWVRPLEEFLSETDRVKYPDAAQRFRFEQVTPEKTTAQPETAAQLPEKSLQPAEGPSLLLAFLDTDDIQEKKAILRGGMNRLTQSDLDGIYTVYGIQRFPGDAREQADGIIRYLNMRSRYEGDRLRKWE